MEQGQSRSKRGKQEQENIEQGRERMGLCQQSNKTTIRVKLAAASETPEKPDKTISTADDETTTTTGSDLQRLIINTPLR